jgi:THO complex subunit 2
VDVWSRVEDLIGGYDLAPARVLDVILDAFAVHLAERWEFFLDLLKLSPWGVPDMGAPAIEVEDRESPLWSWKFGDDVKRERGNRILTQVLGFKFSFYQVSKSIGAPAKATNLTPQRIYLDRKQLGTSKELSGGSTRPLGTSF